MSSKTFSGLTSTAAVPTTSGSDGGVRGYDWRSVRHGFERRQAEAFVERREDEDLGGVVEDAEGVNGSKAEKADVVLALRCGLTARRRSGCRETSSPMMISLRSAKLVFFFQLGLQRRTALIMRTTFLCGLMRPA